jgi:hypothetical protein
MKNPSKNVPEIDALAARLEQWRQTRENHRTRIPEPLWEAATELARKYGVNAVAQRLRLNYMRLRELTDSKTKKRAPAFVELKPSPTPLTAAPAKGVEVELTNSAGEKLAIRLPGGQALDVKGLAASFLDRRR